MELAKISSVVRRLAENCVYSLRAQKTVSSAYSRWLICARLAAPPVEAILLEMVCYENRRSDVRAMHQRHIFVGFLG